MSYPSGRELKIDRKAIGFTINKVAEMLNLTKQTIINIEQGKTYKLSNLTRYDELLKQYYMEKEVCGRIIKIYKLTK